MSTFQQLIQDYLAGPANIRNSIEGMSATQILARPIAGAWSTLECIAHLADFEPIYAARMKRIISHDRPLLLSADENLFAATLGYQERDVHNELTIIESTRRQMAAILNSVPPEAAAKLGVHSFRGLMTLEEMLKSAVGHISHHLKFIVQKRQALEIA